MGLQMRMVVQPKPLRRLFESLLHEQPDRIHGQDVDLQRTLDCLSEHGNRNRFQQTQGLDELPAAVRTTVRFQAPPQENETVRQAPVFQGFGEVQAAWLPLQESQVIDGV